MASLFPDAYMHIGGDENEGKQWDRNPKIQAFMKEKGIKDNHALQAYFNQPSTQDSEKHEKENDWRGMRFFSRSYRRMLSFIRGVDSAALADAAQERIRRHSFEWLLHRPQLSDFTALCCRSDS